MGLYASLARSLYFSSLVREKHIIGPREYSSVIHSSMGMMHQVVIAKKTENGAHSPKPIDFDAVDGAMDLVPQVAIKKAPRK